MRQAPIRAPRRVRWLGTVKARLMLAAALVIAASVSVSTLVVLDRVQGRSEQALIDLESDNAERLASLLAQRVVGLQKALRATAAVMPEAARHDAVAATLFLNANPALAVAFASVFIADARGSLLALHDGTTAKPLVLDLSQRDYFRRTLLAGVPVVSAPLPGRISGEPIIQLTMPVADAGGQVAAVLGGTLRLASRNLFDDLTYAGNSGGEAITTIVTDAQGLIISHPRRDRVMQPIASEPGLTQAVLAWVAKGRPLEPSGFAGHYEDKFVAMAGVPGADWMVFRIAPDAELLGGLVQARREAMAWAAGVALVGSLLILALLAALLGPLTSLRQRALELKNASRAIDEGWPQASGEIGELSRVLQQALRERALGEQAKQTLVQQMNSVLAAAPIGIGFTRQRRFELAGSEFCALLGWPDGALVGRSAHEIFSSADDYEVLGEGVRSAFATGQPYCGEMSFRRRDGSTFWGRLHGRPVAAEDPGAGTIWLLEDVTELRQTRERLVWSASHDALTRLLNRGAFEERLLAWLAQPASAVPAALLFLDLDRFKLVNDSAGHGAGDAVLREVARVLQEQVRASDAVARMGGDEFALLLVGCVAAVAMQLGERLLLAVEQIGVQFAGKRLGVGASIGVVEIDAAAGVPAAAWLARADGACYEAKHAGGRALRLARAPVDLLPLSP